MKSSFKRNFEIKKIKKEFIVIGAGLSGIVSAVQAARLGLSTALINNRGYLGGNASAEIQKWPDGASSCSEFNFYALEGGILLEILLENLWFNPQGNPYIWEAVLRDFLYKEPNLVLFLNTNIDEVQMKNESLIRCVKGSQQGSEIRYEFYGKFFLDDTGDGTIGFLSGAEYRIGRESKNEFNERIAPENSDCFVTPSTLNFLAKNIGREIKFIPPHFAINIEDTDILKYRKIPNHQFYNYQWYYEIGGKLDQIKDSQEIIKKHYELIFGIWDYIKNSGKFNSKNYDFTYIASIPGKRESRRLVGDYILNENDIVNQKNFKDAVGYGGRAIDLHAIEGIFSKEPENCYYLLKGLYQIPFRCGYSKNINNLFFAGRDMSTTHVAFGSTRVNSTLCTLAQALGAAVYICKKTGAMPREIHNLYIDDLQQLLLKEDHFSPGIKNIDKNDKIKNSDILASSVKECKITKAYKEEQVEHDYAIILPLISRINDISLLVKNSKPCILRYDIYEPHDPANWSPDKKVYGNFVEIEPSDVLRWINLPVNFVPTKNKLFLKIYKNSAVILGISNKKLTGVINLRKERCRINRIFDACTLEKKEYVWQQLINTICFKINPKQKVYGPENVANGFRRPYILPNLWMSSTLKEKETLQISFKKEEEISKIILYFDPDFNIDYFPLPQTTPGRAAYASVDAESQLYSKVIKMGFNGVKNAVPTIVKDYNIYCEIDRKRKKITEIRNNYQRKNIIRIKSLKTKKVWIEFIKTNGNEFIRVFEIRIY